MTTEQIAPGYMRVRRSEEERRARYSADLPRAKALLTYLMNHPVNLTPWRRGAGEDPDDVSELLKALDASDEHDLSARD